MKKMVTDSMLMPTYVSRFSCIGGECEDTCCSGWGITIDKNSFLNYQSSFDPVLRPLFTQYVKRDPKSKSARDYGKIDHVQDGCRNCGMLNEKKLCLIQERLGEKALSDTCANYPRQIHHLGDLHQMTMVLSCPEAACLALLAEDAFGFVGLDKTVSQLSITEIKPRGGFTAAAMEDVRTLVFQILRSQDISLSNRLKVIGHFCERLTTLIHTKQAASLPGLLRDIEIDLESGAAMAPWAGMAELPDVQAQFAASFFLKGQEVFQSPHRRRVLFEVAKGLGIQGQTVPDAQTLVHAYEGGLERLAPALAAVPWLLEHFMLNEALREVFPWGEENPMRHYTTLIVRYATARLMLVGRAAAREAPLTPFELAETVQVSCRRYLHDANFTTHAHQVLTEADWDFHKLSALL